MKVRYSHLVVSLVLLAAWLVLCIVQVSLGNDSSNILKSLIALNGAIWALWSFVPKLAKTWAFMRSRQPTLSAADSVLVSPASCPDTIKLPQAPFAFRLGIAAFLLVWTLGWMHALDLVSSTLADFIFHPPSPFQREDLFSAIFVPPFLTIFLFAGIYGLAAVLQILLAIVESFVTEVSTRSESGKVIVIKKRGPITKQLEFLADGIEGVVSGFGSISIYYGGTWVPLTLEAPNVKERIYEVVARAGAPITKSGWVERKRVVNQA
jgi:hypothetical protein